ncbi:hypothetical protein [Fodinibius halophilus]|uniref:hypothetical protein n=1 Tax=Fodinibius halophilus TaxID=1736908 RepID=UPI00197AFB8B|nr:hypothetical protein [Fodinibius halophilus]
MSFMKTLSRDEMKNVKAGDAYLYCETPNGFESWYRTDTTINPTDACRDIYPAYGDSVSGTYGLAPVNK